MQPPVDLSKLSPLVQRVVDPKGPAPMKAMAAKGVVPGLKGFEIVTVIALLSEGDDATAQTARKTLHALPAPLLAGALAPELPPGVVALLAPLYASDVDMRVALFM